MHRMKSSYRGPLNMFHGDIKNTLRRLHFTKHGLHYNKHGNAVLGSTVTHFIRHQGESQCTKESLTFQKTSTDTLVENAAQRSSTVNKSPRNDRTMKLKSTANTYFSLPQRLPLTTSKCHNLSSSGSSAAACWWSLERWCWLCHVREPSSCAASSPSTSNRHFVDWTVSWFIPWLPRGCLS